MKNCCIKIIIFLFIHTYHCLNNGVGKRPPMGWSTWNVFGFNINESLIMEISSLTVSLGLKDAGYEYINIDAGYLTPHRNINNELIVNSTKFPHGIRYISDYIHSLGLKMGVYTDLSNISCGLGPGSLNYYSIDSSTFINDWRADYLKVDLCDHSQSFRDNQLKYFKLFRDSLLNISSNIYYSICPRTLSNTSYTSTQMLYNGSIIDSAPLIWNASDHITTSNSWLVEYKNNKDYWYGLDDNYPSGLITNIDAIIEMSFKGNTNYSNIDTIGSWNDMDMLQVCNFGYSQNSGTGTHSGMNLEEYRSEFTIWSVLSSPLILSMDYRHILDTINGTKCLEMVMNKDVISINQNTNSAHFGQIIYQFPSINQVNNSKDIIQQIFYKIIKTSSGSISYAIVLFNRDINQQNITLKWSYLAINNNTCLQFKNIWKNNTFLGQYKTQYSAIVPSHNVLLLNATIC